MTTEKQISELSDIRAVAILLVNRTGKMVNELQRNQQPAKRTKLKSAVNLKVINNLIKLQTSPKKLTA